MSETGYPEWFAKALDIPWEAGQTEVEDCTINFVSWGDRGNPGIVLVHGSNAHLEWWRMIAPLLCDQFHVVAFDLSGSGGSGWRDQYSSQLFGEEVVSVARAAGMRARPCVVGHSFGGLVALETGHRYGANLGGVILADYTVSRPGKPDGMAEYARKAASTPFRPTRIYGDRASALARFRLLPEQTCKHPYLVSYLAEHSLREVEGGWTWKFDPGMYNNLNVGNVTEAEKLQSLECPVAFIMAEESQDYSAEAAVYTEEVTHGVIPHIRIPQTHHHLMLDEPIAMAMAIKGMLLNWVVPWSTAS